MGHWRHRYRLLSWIDVHLLAGRGRRGAATANERQISRQGSFRHLFERFGDGSTRVNPRLRLASCAPFCLFVSLYSRKLEWQAWNAEEGWPCTVVVTRVARWIYRDLCVVKRERIEKFPSMLFDFKEFRK